MKCKSEKQIYTKPQLEQHQNFTVVTGVSLPIGTSALDNPLEAMDFMEQQ